jgi:myo-inositol-1(or 4)-monophosphatase
MQVHRTAAGFDIELKEKEGVDIDEKILDSYLKVALEAANRGAAILKKFWGTKLDIREKGTPFNLVTEADKASEEEIIKILTKNFPNHSILAEESGLHKAYEADFLWAIDPLDGTTNYAHSFPFVAVSVGLLFQRQPIVGVVYNPIMDELFYAAKGRGSFYNQTKMAVSQTSTLEKSLLASGFSYQRQNTADNNYAEFCHLTDLTQGVRRAGAASLDLAYVAMGRFDGYWENGLKAWDIAAGALLVEEAGGKVTSYDQTPLDFMQPKILATNGLLHAALANEIKPSKQLGK